MGSYPRHHRGNRRGIRLGLVLWLRVGNGHWPVAHDRAGVVPFYHCFTDHSDNRDSANAADLGGLRSGSQSYRRGSDLFLSDSSEYG